MSECWRHPQYLDMLKPTSLKRSYHQIGKSNLISSRQHCFVILGRANGTSGNLRYFSQPTQRARRRKSDAKTSNVLQNKLEACQNARELSMLLRSNGKLFYNRQGFEQLQQEISDLIKTARMTAPQVAGLMNAVSGLSTVAKSQQRQVLLDLSQKVAMPLLRHCQIKEICMILNSLARKNVRNDELFHDASHLLLESIARMNPQDLAIVSNAYARVHYKSHKLFDAIALQANSQVQDFAPQGLANLVNAFAKQDHSDNELFDAVARQVQDCLLKDDSSFTPQGLANIANAFGKMNHSHDQMFAAIAEASTPIIDDFNPQNLSNMANAYAKMNHSHPNLFRAIENAALGKMTSFKAQELANLANAFVKMSNDQIATLLQEIVQVAIPLLSTFKAQELTMLLNALTKTHPPAELKGDVRKFWRAAARATMALLPDFDPAQLCVIANAFSKVPNEMEKSMQLELFDKIAATALGLLANPNHAFQPQNLANLANAYAKVNLHAVDMFQVLVIRAIPLLPNMKPQELANLTSAIAKLRIEGQMIEELFAQTAILLQSDNYKFRSWESRNLVEVSYAFLKAFQMDEDLLETIGSELDSRPNLELDAVGLGHLAATLSRKEISCSKELLSGIFTSFENIPQDKIQISNLADIGKALPLAYELGVISTTDGFMEWMVKHVIAKRHQANPSDIRDLLLNLTSPRLNSDGDNTDDDALLELQRSLLVAYQPILEQFSDQIATKHMTTIRRAYKRLSVPI